MEMDRRTEVKRRLNSCKRKFSPKELDNIISKRDNDGDTILMLLVMKKQSNFADYIIKQCLDANLLDVQNNYGQSLLHVAVYLRQIELVARLILKGARIDFVDCMGRNIFHVCAKYGYLDIFKAIIQTSIRTTKCKLLGKLVDSIDYDGYTPFYLAAKNENKDFCKYLSSLGVNVNSVNPKNGNTVLHHVVLSNIYSNQLDFIKFLIEECNIDVKIQNYFEMTAGVVAQVNGKENVVSYLQNIA